MNEPLHTLADWRRAYARGARPRELLAALLQRLDPADPAWILRADAAFVQAQLDALPAAPDPRTPLWGLPFAVKDNIDVAGLPTTAACPAFAHPATRSATVVQRLQAAGAILVGKTNLDQFATGLVGTRSPYGEVPNSFDSHYVSGGSSSGSASVVARGLVPFALGTDTAGSGRVPAAFNNLVGLKPTPGSMPMQGVLPACRSLDVVSVFALTLADAAEVMACCEGLDVLDAEPCFGQAAPRLPWLGDGGPALRLGVPRAPAILGGAIAASGPVSTVEPTPGWEGAFEAACQRAMELGAELVDVDFEPLDAVARLLYEGPWLAERAAVVAPLLEGAPEAMDPVVRQVIARGRDFSAVEAWRARYRLEELRAQLARLWHNVDALMVPTAPTCPTRAAVARAPIARNSELGRYTNFVNLLGLAALALPSRVPAPGAGIPFGVSFIAPGGSDAALVDWGLRWEAAGPDTLGAGLRDATPFDRMPRRRPRAAPTRQLAVVGAHLQGLPLHGQLVARRARLLARTHTAPQYRLHALPGTTPPKPGLARVGPGQHGHAIEVEVYELPEDSLGSFLALIPPPLGLGSVELADGEWVQGFVCEPWALAEAPDISAHGGWRAYLASR